MKEFKAITEKILINAVDFSSTSDEVFKTVIEVMAEREGIINCIYLSSLLYLDKDSILNDTNSLNGPVVVPIHERYVKQNEKITLSIKYRFGGGYENYKAVIN